MKNENTLTEKLIKRKHSNYLIFVGVINIAN